MNKKILTLGLMLFAGLGATAQVSLVNPVPQEVNIAGENALFEAPAQWSINAGKLSGHIYDALATASPEIAKKASFKVTVGVRGDKQVNKYKKQIPAKTEGYFLKVTNNEVVIAGNDESGLFYELTITTPLKLSEDDKDIIAIRHKLDSHTINQEAIFANDKRY